MPARRRPVRSCNSTYRQTQQSDSDSSSEAENGHRTNDLTTAIPMEIDRSGFVMTPARINITPTPLPNNAAQPMDWDLSLLLQSDFSCQVCREHFSDVMTKNRHERLCKRQRNQGLSDHNTTFETMVQSLPEASQTAQTVVEPPLLSPEASMESPPTTDAEQPCPEQQPPLLVVTVETAPAQTAQTVVEPPLPSPETSMESPPTTDDEQPFPEQQPPPLLVVTAEAAPELRLSLEVPSEYIPYGKEVNQQACPVTTHHDAIEESTQLTFDVEQYPAAITSLLVVEASPLVVDSANPNSPTPTDETPDDPIAPVQQSPPPVTVETTCRPDNTTASLAESASLLQDCDSNLLLQSRSSLNNQQPPSGPTTIPSLFKCPSCPRTFATKSGLGTHKRVHKNAAHHERATVPSTQEEAPVPNQNAEMLGPTFSWGGKSGHIFTSDLNVAYEKIVFFRQNIFKLPSGSVGKDFIRELTSLIRAWNSNSALRDIALKCVMVLPALLLQKPSRQSKSKEHVTVLKRRLAAWRNGDILDLLDECSTIQTRLVKSTPKNTTKAISKRFADLMKQGKVNAAVKLLTASMQGGILPLTDETMTLLHTKHPEPGTLNEDAVYQHQAPPVHPIVFDAITAESVRKAAMNTKGGAGPSGVDADGWRHILVSRNFGLASEELRSELALLIRKLCTEQIEVSRENDHTSSNLEALLACRLIPVDKSPGLRPIGVGEVLRRIAGKVVMSVAKGDVQCSVGSLQVCAGQAGGCEAAIHAMRNVFEDEESDAILLIDAANAFNSMNRATMLENIKKICPIVYTYAFNCYATHARLFVLGGQEIRSCEGTTQGDPPSMAFYAIGLLPLLWSLPSDEANGRQVAYADDLTGGGELNHLKTWFDAILLKGPMFGYHAEPSKSWLVVKEEKYEEAKALFENTSVNITTRGKKHLGAIVGHPEYKDEFVGNLVEEWVSQIKKLSELAQFEPHAAFTAFTSCIRHKYTFYMRTIPGISSLLAPLEHEIRHSLIPALTDGRVVTDDERKLLSLPARLGGMGLVSPVDMCDHEHDYSRQATHVLTEAILAQQKELPADLDTRSKEVKSDIHNQRRNHQSNVLEDIRARMSVDQQRANDICCETGASSWLTTLPLEDKGFALTKREFWDAVSLRYGWPIRRLPSKCACGAVFDVTHALSCKKGGFVTQRHNELRDMTADLLAEVCPDVSIEPHLEELTGETLGERTANASEGARLDVSARGVWSRNQRAFFDVRVFNPHARRFQNQTLAQAYLSNENEKKRAYNERVLQIENGTFTPLVFNVCGGMGRECITFYKRLSTLISEKRQENLSSVSTWIRTRICFALLRSTLMCLRGTRHRYHRANVNEIDMELDLHEAAIRQI